MTLTLYPAIDLKGGQVVRLKRGEMDQATVYAEDPGKQAAAFIEAGFSWVHVVDLDGAFAGKPANAEAVRAILAAVPGARVQLGGGIRTMAVAEAWLAAGVTRIILGSAALKDPDFAREACHGAGVIAAAIDGRFHDGRARRPNRRRVRHDIAPDHDRPLFPADGGWRTSEGRCSFPPCRVPL